jgi:hypothetical protein
VRHHAGIYPFFYDFSTRWHFLAEFQYAARAEESQTETVPVSTSSRLL